MAEQKVQFFLGANAPTGFYSLYDQLIDPNQAEDIFILKGGPGCGKSSLMRRVGEEMENHGQAVEYIACSGDPESLDAVIIPGLKTAIVDGTAPHVVEPRYPGVVEHYVNLGDCYDSAALKSIRQEIAGALDGYQGCYKRAYRCLLAAAQIEEDVRTLLLTPAAEGKLIKRARGILAREVKKNGTEAGQAVQRFLGGITHQGVLCKYGTVDALCKRVYDLSDSYGLAHVMLTHLAAGAMAAGWDVVVCPSPMFPDRIEHLLIPALSLAFVTSNGQYHYEKRPYRRLRLDAMADQEMLRQNKARLRFSHKVAAALVEEAVASLAEAKAMHDNLEALYNPHVAFDQVYRTAGDITERLIARLPE